MKLFHNIAERFARIRLDDADRVQEHVVRTESAPDGASGYEWPGSDAEVVADHSVKQTPVPAPAEGERFRLLKADELPIGSVTSWNGGSDTGTAMRDALLRASIQLADSGLSLVPDARCPFRVKPGDRVALFRTPPGGLYPISYRSVTMTVVYLAVWLIQNDGATASDIETIDAWIASSTPKSRSPLPQQGMLRWLLSRRRILSKRVKTRAASQMSRFVRKREEALGLLLGLTAGGSDRRVANLEKLMPLFGLDPGKVHSELHRYMTSRDTSGLSHAEETSNSRSLAPLRPDGKKLARMEEDTREAQRMLNAIFADSCDDRIADSDIRGSTPETLNRESGATCPERSLLEALAEKEEWSRVEFAQLCRRLELTPGAALEDLNDLSFERLGYAAAEEEGDTIMTDPEAVESLLRDMS